MSQEGEDRMIDLLSLMLDEVRDVKQELRELKAEQRLANEQLAALERGQTTTNDRLGAIEYALLNDARELRSRMEIVESRVARLEGR